MITFYHLFRHLRCYGAKHRTLYLLSVMILFWGLFDGIISYLVPQVITEHGFSKTVMGLIYASSSVAGAIFDFVACRIFRRTLFRRLFLLMFAACGLFPILLIRAQTVGMYLIAMAVWGIYYDLKSFGSFDFVGRYTAKHEHASSFGVIQVFQAIGYLLAPVAAGAVIGGGVGWQPFAMAWIFLIVSYLVFGLLLWITRRHRHGHLDPEQSYRRGLGVEVKIWSRLGRVMLPVLVLTMMLNVVDAFFWTIGPLFAESFAAMHRLAGLFMFAHMLPVLIVGWMVGYTTSRFGKKRTAFISLFLGSIILSLIYFMRSPVAIFLTVLCSSFLMSLAWPAVNGAFADYISEGLVYAKEIEGLEDFYANLGYIVGPLAAGWLADRIGNQGSFAVLGILGAVTALILIKITPKEINIPKRIAA